MEFKNIVQIFILIIQLVLVILMFKMPTYSTDTWFMAIIILLLCIICILVGGLL